MYKQKNVKISVAVWLYNIGFYDDVLAKHAIDKRKCRIDLSSNQFNCLRINNTENDECLIGLPLPTYTDVMLWLTDLHDINGLSIEFDLANSAVIIDGTTYKTNNDYAKLEDRIEGIVVMIFARKLVTTPFLNAYERAEKMACEIYKEPKEGTNLWFEKEGYKKAIVQHLFNL